MTSNRDASFPAIAGIPAFSNFPRLFMALRVSKGWTQYFFLKKISSALYFISLETIYFIKNDFRRSLFHLAGEKIYFIENRFPALSFIWPEKIIMCRQLAVNSTTRRWQVWTSLYSMRQRSINIKCSAYYICKTNHWHLEPRLAPSVVDVVKGPMKMQATL